MKIKIKESQDNNLLSQTKHVNLMLPTYTDEFVFAKFKSIFGSLPACRPFVYTLRGAAQAASRFYFDLFIHSAKSSRLTVIPAKKAISEPIIAP